VASDSPLAAHFHERGQCFLAVGHYVFAPRSEATARGWISEVWGLSRDLAQGSFGAVGLGNGADESLGVGVEWLFNYFLDTALLLDMACIHHDHMRCYGPHHAEIVCDDHNRQPALAILTPQQEKHLGLHPNVKSRGWFVSD
jgi:hypothetical protein